MDQDDVKSYKGSVSSSKYRSRVGAFVTDVTDLRKKTPSSHKSTSGKFGRMSDKESDHTLVMNSKLPGVGLF